MMLCMTPMQTTVRIDDDLLAQLKERARAEGVSLAELVNRILRMGVDRKRPRRRSVRIRPVDMGAPRIDLDRALHVATEIEDAEILRKLALRKWRCSMRTSCCTPTTPRLRSTARPGAGWRGRCRETSRSDSRGSSFSRFSESPRALAPSPAPSPWIEPVGW